MKISEIAYELASSDCKNVIQAEKFVRSKCASLPDFVVSHKQCYIGESYNMTLANVMTVSYKGFKIAEFYKSRSLWRYAYAIRDYNDLCGSKRRADQYVDDFEACVKTIDRYLANQRFDPTSLLTYRECPAPYGFYGVEKRFVTERMQRYLQLKSKLRDKQATLQYCQEQIKRQKSELKKSKSEETATKQQIAAIENELKSIPSSTIR